MERVREMIGSETGSFAPFTLLSSSDDPQELLNCAQQYAGSKFAQPAVIRNAPRAPEDGRIRLGYLSADFSDHPTGQLIAGLFEAHDKSRFELHAISYGTDDGDSTRQRLQEACEHFHDLSGHSNAEIAAAMDHLGIQIAVDLDGYTINSRPGILAHRPAPVQVHMLGYAGTLGAGFIDYLVADETVAPLQTRPFFSESLILQPRCYQVNGTRQPLATGIPSREALCLPETAFVFCCFNNSYKVTPEVFDVWMRLLNNTPDAVLWLLMDRDTAVANLRKEAQDRGVDPERLHFAPRCGQSQHIARQACADLFLDTFPYNAHATASDAIWAGLPLITCRGRSFQSRVAASILLEVGLDDLVTDSLDAYEQLALELTKDRGRLDGYRRVARRAKQSSRLFDSHDYARNIEAAYEVIWARYCSGDQPHSFSLKNTDARMR
jgi:predicted O-linked N-acetylglucosamine transferase (SPINDLY family)